MTFIISMLSGSAYLELPRSVLGWAGWLTMFGALVWVGFRLRESKPTREALSGLLMAALLLSAPLASLFFGVRLPLDRALPLANQLLEPRSTIIMLVSALPWVLAGGFLGQSAALVVALVSGVALALWGTHNPFTILEVTGLAVLFTACVRQRYRTAVYQALRHPVIAAIALALGFTPVYVLSHFFATPGALAVRMDSALTQSWQTVVANGGALFIAGVLAEALYAYRISAWGRKEPLQPSPGESSLQLRFIYVTTPLVVILVLALMISNWVVAGAAAQKMIRDRLSSTALVAAESLPYIMETGQSQIINLANDNLLGIQPDKLQPVLSERLRALPFFRQLSFFNARGELVAAYPITRLDEMRLSPQELAGIHLALKGVVFQTYTLDAWPGENSAQISFMAAVMNAKGRIEGVLVGRTDLSSNPFTQPAIQSLETMKAIGGEGMILDENDRILYHTQPALVMANYLGVLSDQEEFFDETTPAGKRRLVFHRPTIGRPWSVVLTVPAEYVQQLTLTIAMPMLLLLPLLSLLAVVSLRLGLRSVTSSLNKLANEVTLIAQGDLDQPVRVEGEDEVGRFGKAFEQMRISLKARLEEINRLLLVSQGVAAHLKLEDAVRPVLEAALGDSSALARLVLGGELRVEPSRDSLIVLGLGPASEEWAYLDPQIFELARQQNIVVIPNMQRLRQLNIPAGSPMPGSLLAQAVCHENTYYGVLWVGYTEPRSFSEEERRYLTTLASQAALAVINARLYATQEIGRQRLESVLSSSPDPVLVIDEQLCINLVNPAALQAPGLIASACLGKPVRDVIQNPDLLALLVTTGDEKTASREITTPHGMVYNASVSPVVVDGKSAGTVCILQDITHYKALDVLKSDFISTVSQGLRTPLAQLRGSAAMLERVGDLNEPQKNYVEKILSGIERMNELVSNLLDQGRIDGRGGLIIESVSALDIVGQVMDSLAPQASQKKITLHKIGVSEDGDASSCEIHADRVLLEQALFNLVENAIKYSRSGGEVVVKCEPRDDQFVFEVKDKGAGIAPLDVENIFEKPSRNARRGAGKPGGTGISLAMVKSIVERHRGRVWAESVLGKGSSFYMEIPIHQSAD